MMDFSGIPCPVCGKPFTKDDDIVVCPVCGAPYHRACYQEAGHCVYEDKHGTPDAWHPPAQQEEIVHNSVRCPQCGHRNPPGSTVCSHCGKSLLPDEEPQDGPQQGSPFEAPGGPGNGPWSYGGRGNMGGAMPFMFDPMGGVDPDTSIDGVKASDLAKAVQSNTTYYLPVFQRQVQARRHRFNGAAFLLSGAWLLYRKQYALGAVITVVELALQFLWNYIDLAFVAPILYDALQAASDSSASLYAMTQAQTEEIAVYLTQLSPFQQFLIVSPFLILLGILVLHIVVGAIANHIYRKHCVKLVEKIQAKTSEPGEMLILYQERGGINSMPVFFVFIAYLVLTYLPGLIL